MSSDVITVKEKCIFTAALYFTFFASGITFAILPPSLTELQNSVNTDDIGISTIYTSRSAGYLVGALSGGILFSCLNRQLCLIGLIFMMAASLYGYTVASDLTSLNILAALNGFSSGGSDTAINVYVLELWGLNCGPFMQGLHFFFALGTGTAPLLLVPYLNNHGEAEALFTNVTDFTEFNATTSDLKLATEFVSHLHVPYGISSGLIVGASLLLLISHLLYGKNTQRSESSSFTEATKSLATSLKDTKLWIMEKNNRMAVVLVTLSCCTILVYSGMEIIYFEYMPKFVVHASKLDVPIQHKEASYMYSVMNYVYMASRGIAIVLAMKCSPELLIYTDFAILAFANSILLVSNGSRTGLWAGNVFMGTGFASVYASLYAFIEQHIQVTNAIGALFVFSSGLTAVVYPLIVGSFIADKPLYLIWLTMISVIVTCALFSIMYYIVTSRMSRVTATPDPPVANVDPQPVIQSIRL
ncbi:Major facilitator superfamily domain-containing protein 4B [Halotydeus destructor]|nr:Major facilitator superfamily domain-containing protein 4B [Halotydeus destructor]